MSEGLCLLGGAPFTLSVLSAVATLITLLPIMDEGIIAAQSGGLPLGVINLGNIAVHYVPVVVLVVLVGQRSGCVHDTFSRIDASVAPYAPWVPRAVVWLTGVPLPLAFGGAYVAWYDFQAEYSVNAAHGPVYLAGLLTLVVTTLGLWMLLYQRRIC
jgi:hypothetical protein